MAIILNSTELKYLLIDSLKLYTEDSVFLSGNNPYKFSINKKIFYIYIKNVHDSGEGRTNPDECRIQFGRSDNFLAAKQSGIPVLFLGYYAEKNVFTAWNPFIQTDRINTRTTLSVYSRFSIQEKVSQFGIAVYVDNNQQVIISFKPEYLGLYLENFEKMHASDEVTLLELINKSNQVESTEEEGEEQFDVGREKFTVKHRRFKRDPGFRRLVCEAYGFRCSICGIQLELVIAAHIIPHSHEKGVDEPVNGICLCSIHHDAYDNGLIYFDEEYHIRINNAKVEYLTKVKRDGGLKKFIDLQFDSLELPSSQVTYPSPDLIKIANEIRGIEV